MFIWNKNNCQNESQILEKEQIELLKKKFIIGVDRKSEVFLEEIIKWGKDHDREATKHKNKYFKINGKVNRGVSFTKSVKTWKGVVLAVVPGISITVIVQMILNILEDYFGEKFREEFRVIAIICLIFTMLLCIKVFFGIESSKKELELRQYGETWVRHRGTWWNLKQEMLLYLYDLGEYNQKTQLEKKQFFMERMMILENADMEEFKKNMKDKVSPEFKNNQQ